MSKNKKTVKKDAKKITRLICFIFLTLALLVGIIFSSVKVNMTMTYGPEYNGAYQASVQVLKNNKPIDKSELDEAADSLSNKLAPFSDKSVSVSKQGQNHLNVLVGKQDYENNQTFLRNQIQANGGLYMLRNDGDNVYTDVTVSGDTHTLNNELFNESVKARTLSDGNGRKSFVELALKDVSKFSALFADNKDANGQTTSNSTKPVLFVSNLESMIDSIRYLYSINDSEKTIKVYYNDIISKVRDIVDKSKDNTEKLVLRDLFGGTIEWNNVGSVVKQTKKISLLDKNIDADGFNVNGKKITTIDSWENLKEVLKAFTPNTSEKPTSSFIYGADDKTINTDYKGWLDDKSSSTLNKNFGFITKDLLPLILDTNSTDYIPTVNKDIKEVIPDFNNYFIYNGAVDTKGSDNSLYTEVGKNVSFVVDETKTINSGISNTLANEKSFYLRTRNLTAAKRTVASVRENALGISYLVESISNVNPYVTSALYITSIVVLSLIALLLSIYVLFVYRLLGLFTILIAACSIAIMLLIATLGFSIAFGPQTLAAMFVILALVLDANFVLFEGFKKSYYKDKHGVMSSFRIGNRETLAMVIDTVVIAFIPNLVLFWAGSGSIKGFATMAIIGVALAIVCGIGIARFIYWLLLQSKFVSDHEWMLPIDTTFSSLEAMRDEYFINKYTHYLEDHEGKDKYSTKELAKIAQYKKELAIVQKQYHVHLLENNKKTIERDEKTIKRINKNTEWLTNVKNWFIKVFKIKQPVNQPIVRLLDSKIDDNKVVTDLAIKAEANEESTKPESKLQDKGKVVRETRFVGRGSFWFIVAMIILTIISAIVGGVVGPNWSSSVGYGQQFVIYGESINEIQRNYIQNQPANPDQKLIDVANKIKDKYAEDIKQINDKNDKNKAEQLNRVYAYEVQDLVKYIVDNDAYELVGIMGGYSKQINLHKTSFDVLYNYEHIDNKTGAASGKDVIAIRINSSATNEHSRSTFKRVLLHLYNPAYSVSTKPNQKSDDSIVKDAQIDAYDMAPYSINFQIKEIAVALGITLAVLIVYILIRFKWTYYIALALGLVLTVGIVVAMVVIFRVPVSAELLSAMSFILTFATTSMILVLGKGRSELNLQNKDAIKQNFAGEIKISASIRAKKAETKSVYAPIQKEVKRLKKQIRKLKKQIKKTGNGYDELAKLEGDLNLAAEKLSVTKKEQQAIYKDFKDKAKQKQNEEQRKNWYFKKLFSDLINYSAWRMATLGVFYLLVGIVLAITLPSIVGLGITIIFGILAAFAVALFIAVPVWVFFEKRRIRYVYGRKSYIESLKVSHEEETVPGIND